MQRPLGMRFGARGSKWVATHTALGVAQFGTAHNKTTFCKRMILLLILLPYFPSCRKTYKEFLLFPHQINMFLFASVFNNSIQQCLVHGLCIFSFSQISFINTQIACRKHLSSCIKNGVINWDLSYFATPLLPTFLVCTSIVILSFSSVE